MSPEDSELLASVLLLPEPVRAHFAREILASLDDSPEGDVEERWQVEIERRTDEVLAANAEIEDAEAVHAGLRARLCERAR